MFMEVSNCPLIFFFSHPFQPLRRRTRAASHCGALFVVLVYLLYNRFKKTTNFLEEFEYTTS